MGHNANNSEGKENCYQGHILLSTPDKCSTGPGTWPPGFISGGGQGGDFDGDGDEDVIVIAGIGDRPFLALGSDEDKSCWSTIHLFMERWYWGDYHEDFQNTSGNEPLSILHQIKF
ncbi:MAG: hypothetical protein CM15mP12_0500 [Gammaproteobacteria bacterium]|nr:MAG: hypothetical protein CM15mP12_0500 [Gammaproteobacteria bacterium]